MNSVNLVGRIVKDPALSYTKSNKAFVRFTLAVDRHIPKDKVQEGTQTADFISCTAWNKTAEIIGQYAKNGSLVEVSGSINTGSYEKDGQKVYTTDVMVNNFYILSSKNDSSGSSSTISSGTSNGSCGSAMPNASQSHTQSNFSDIYDDDIPF
jgi:single-strand binding protein